MTIEAPPPTTAVGEAIPLPSIADLVESILRDARRPEDGLLHCSSDLHGPLRHAMLRITGAPFIEEPIASRIRLMTGTLWHQAIAKGLAERKHKVISEVNVSAGLPKGWSGTLDHLIFDPPLDAWRIIDIKTQRAEAFGMTEAS